MVTEKREAAAIIIQAFADAQAVVAAALANTVVGDAAPLTCLTVSMIHRVIQVFDPDASKKAATETCSLLITGSELTKYAASRFVAWMPWVGNAFNANVIYRMAISIGWMTYFLYEQGKDSYQVTEKDLETIKWLAETERIEPPKQFESMLSKLQEQSKALAMNLGKVIPSEQQSIIEQMIDLLNRHLSPTSLPASIPAPAVLR